MSRPAIRRLAGGALLLALVSCRSGQSEVPKIQRVMLPDRIQGATIRAVGDLRRGYGTERARQTLLRLKQMGVNTIGVLLEGHMADVHAREIRGPSADERQAARAALEDAAELGLATVLVPHLYLDDGGWRGDIAPNDEAQADRFWAAHDRFILEAADVAEAGRASLLSIGVELKGLSSKPDTKGRMAQLASRVRERFRGRLTYSANWDEAEQVVFWDTVDIAGVNGYYPLLPDPVRGAESVHRRLAALADLAGREVLVLEVGYRSGPMSHLRPWEWPQDVPDDIDQLAQARAWAAVLSQWLGAPEVRGLMVWVIPTDPDDPASEPPNGFNPLNKPAEEVIRRAFTQAPGSMVQALGDL